MALTTNQGLILPDAIDNANVPLTFTDFVTTPVSGMENRLVQRYLSSADRTARNPAPIEGEISYLSDLNRYDGYTGTAWVALYPQTQYAAAVASFTSAVTTYTTAGAALLGVTLQVPLSGQVRVDFSAELDQNAGGNLIFISPQLNAGNVVGAGATLVLPSDDISAQNVGTDNGTFSNFVVYAGLTVGSDVNVFLNHRVNTGTGTFARRKILMSQA